LAGFLTFGYNITQPSHILQYSDQQLQQMPSTVAVTALDFHEIPYYCLHQYTCGSIYKTGFGCQGLF